MIILDIVGIVTDASIALIPYRNPRHSRRRKQLHSRKRYKRDHPPPPQRIIHFLNEKLYFIRPSDHRAQSRGRKRHTGRDRVSDIAVASGHRRRRAFQGIRPTIARSVSFHPVPDDSKRRRGRDLQQMVHATDDDHQKDDDDELKPRAADRSSHDVP